MCEDNKQYREEREQQGSFISTPQSSCFANAKNGSKCGLLGPGWPSTKHIVIAGGGAWGAPSFFKLDYVFQTNRRFVQLCVTYSSPKAAKYKTN